MAEIQYYYCLTHQVVEPSDQGCRAVDRLGPYPDRAAAEQALDRVADRNDEWENDPDWSDPDDDED